MKIERLVGLVAVQVDRDRGDRDMSEAERDQHITPPWQLYQPFDHICRDPLGRQYSKQRRKETILRVLYFLYLMIGDECCHTPPFAIGTLACIESNVKRELAICIRD